MTDTTRPAPAHETLDPSATYAIDDAHGTEICAGLPANVARATAGRIADERNAAVYLYAVGSSAEPIEVAPPATIALVETMPEQYRESHRAASNEGSYPHNGATREWMSISDAEALQESDPEWTSIVRRGRTTITMPERISERDDIDGRYVGLAESVPGLVVAELSARGYTITEAEVEVDAMRETWTVPAIED